MSTRKPYKVMNENAWLLGVCGGISYAYDMPVTFVRVATVVLTIFTFPVVVQLSGSFYIPL